ncbi:MAG: hypothetical protein QNJ35_15460 [Paracoccaceae bacterium]|nr:hypothetical protein [Paracoccaceae bacterium]
MTDDPSEKAGTDGSRWLLKQSETALTDVLAAFEIMVTRFRKGENVPDSEIQKACIVHSAVRNRLLEQVEKHEKQVLLDGGLLAEAPLDFDEIRREVGRHLDRIRDAERSGELPDGAVE